MPFVKSIRQLCLKCLCFADSDNMLFRTGRLHVLCIQITPVDSLTYLTPPLQGGPNYARHAPSSSQRQASLLAVLPMVAGVAGKVPRSINTFVLLCSSMHFSSRIILSFSLLDLPRLSADIKILRRLSLENERRVETCMPSKCIYSNIIVVYTYVYMYILYIVLREKYKIYSEFSEYANIWRFHCHSNVICIMREL